MAKNTEKSAEVETNDKDREKAFPVFKSALIKPGFISVQRLCRPALT